jgi:hypothetical protein
MLFFIANSTACCTQGVTLLFIFLVFIKITFAALPRAVPFAKLSIANLYPRQNQGIKQISGIYFFIFFTTGFQWQALQFLKNPFKQKPSLSQSPKKKDQRIIPPTMGDIPLAFLNSFSLKRGTRSRRLVTADSSYFPIFSYFLSVLNKHPSVSPLYQVAFKSIPRRRRGIDPSPLTLTISPVGRGVGEGRSMTRRQQRYSN